MWVRVLVVVGAVSGIVGCASGPPASEVAKARQDVSAEIMRVCGLAPAEREKELERLKNESGLVLYCGKDEGKAAE